MKTLTIEQMQRTGGGCKSIGARLGVMFSSSMSAGMIATGFALGLASGGMATAISIGGMVVGAGGGYLICRLSRS